MILTILKQIEIDLEMLANQFKTNRKSVWNFINVQLVYLSHQNISNWKIEHWLRISSKLMWIQPKFFTNRLKHLWEIDSKCTSNIFKIYSKSIQYSCQIDLKLIAN